MSVEFNDCIEMGCEQRTQPLFSVVIPLYNKADTIARTVRSVATQTFKDWELIVVNDGSTDDSLSVAKRLSKDIPMRIIDKSNGGVSSARNEGARVAAGQYIALLDGDDIWFPNHLALLAKAIAKHPEVKFFGTGYERVLKNYVYYTIPWGGCCVKDVYLAFRYGQPIHTSTVAIDRLLWLSLGGFDPRFSFYEDYEFFFRLGMHTKCCVIRNISGQYMDDASVQATKIKRCVSRMTRPHLALVDEMLGKGVATAEMLSFAATQFGLLVYNYSLNGDCDGIRRLMKDFPHIANRHTATRFNWSAQSLGYRFYINVFVAIYKFRCHLINWRKNA